MKTRFDADKFIYIGLSSIFMVIFIPVLFCIFMFGNTMDYNTVNKLIAIYGNKRLVFFGLLILFVLFAVFWLFRKVEQKKRTTMITVVSLSLAFLLLYFINEEICKCIWFPQGWDAGRVVGTAYSLEDGNPIGTDTYYSMYPNNVPMAFILYRIYSWASHAAGYPYKADFLWLQVICAMISIAGLAVCMTVRKLTDNLGAVLACFLLYVASIGISPWKTVPYTDMYAMMFPILCLCLYVHYYYAKKTSARIIYFFFAFLTGVLGALIKPTVMIVPVAIVLLELVYMFLHIKQEWKGALVKLVLILITVLLYKGALNFIYEDTGYIQNQEISATWHHYLVMGLNQDTTGSYSTEDAGLIGQYPVRAERKEVQLHMAAERIKEMGLAGYLKFLLTKTVMTFNDGTFNWGREGVFYIGKYPVLSKGSGEYVMALQNTFWPEHKYSGQFNTYCQTVWLAILLGLPGLCLCKKRDRSIQVILVSILGIILYLMLFEARARYLICFTPVFILATVVGMVRYYELLQSFVKKYSTFWENKRNKGCVLRRNKIKPADMQAAQKNNTEEM